MYQQTRQQNPSDLLSLHRTELPTEMPVGCSELDLLFITSLRIPQFFADARREIEPKHFRIETEIHYATLWKAMNTAFDRAGGFYYETLVVTVQQAFQAEPSPMLPEMWQNILDQSGGLLHHAMWEIDPAQIDLETAYYTLQRFLRERAVAVPVQNLLQTNYDGSYAANTTDILATTLERAQRIDSLRTSPVPDELLPERATFVPEPEQYTPTGFDYIDDYIGGERDGDANGLLGPFGSGKSTMLRAMGIRKARAQAAAEAREGGAGVVFYVSYEEPLAKFEKRLWANAAKIQFERLRNLQSVDELTEDERRETYENALGQEAFRAYYAPPTVTPGMMYPGERTRWDAARYWLNKYFAVSDMSGSGRYPNAGYGGIDELVGTIERTLTRRGGLPCRGVHIDYAGLMVARWMERRHLSQEYYTGELARLGERCRRMIAERFDCPVWLAHQFSGEANKRHPSALLHHADAKGSRSFAENLAVCGCLGNKDQETGCIRLNWSKVRYAFSLQKPPILQIDGDFCEHKNVSSEYHVTSNKRFVPTGSDPTYHGTTPSGEAGGRPRMNVSSAAGYNSYQG